MSKEIKYVMMFYVLRILNLLKNLIKVTIITFLKLEIVNMLKI